MVPTVSETMHRNVTMRRSTASPPTISVIRFLESLDIEGIADSCVQKVSPESVRSVLRKSVFDAIESSVAIYGGLSELVELFSAYCHRTRLIGTQNVSNIADKRVHLGKDFPPPIDTLTRGKLYDLIEVADWMESKYRELVYLKWIDKDHEETDARRRLKSYVDKKIRVSLGMMDADALKEEFFPDSCKKYDLDNEDSSVDIDLDEQLDADLW